MLLFTAMSLIGFLLSTALAIYSMSLIITSVTARWDEPLCPQCGYDLRGSNQRDGRCPECGCVRVAGDRKPYIERNFKRGLLGLLLLIISCVGYLFTVVVGFSRLH